MSKSISELYGEVMASGELKKQYLAAANDGKIADFLKEHGCDATPKQLDEFLANPANLPQGEIADDELDSVAGGTCYKQGRPVVTVMNSCKYWTCEKCGGTDTKVYNDLVGIGSQCSRCEIKCFCMNCKYCRYEDALWQCYNPQRHND